MHLLLFLAIALLPLGPTKPAHAAAPIDLKLCNPVTQANLGFCAAYLDPLRSARWRRAVPGGYRSPLGIQVHPSCLDWRVAHDHVSRVEAERDFESLFQGAFADVLASCRARYPLLEPYLSSWLAQARRTVITCPGVTAKRLGAYARNGVFEVELDVDATQDSLKGIALPEGDLSRLDTRFQTTVLYSIDADHDTGNPDWAGARGSLIHEIFHSTGANNQLSHDSLENIPFDDSRPCARSVADDRVNVVADLCAGDVMGARGGPKSVPEVLARRIHACGMRKGCQEVFTSRIGLIARPWMPSGALGDADAQSVCELIEDDAACADRLKSGSSDANAPVSGPFDRLPALGRAKKRLDALVPDRQGVIPGALIGAYPDLERGFESLGATHCFNSLFEPWHPGQPLILKGVAHRSEFESDERFLYPASHLSDSAWYLKLAIQNASIDCQPGYGPAIARNVDELASRAEAAFSSSYFRQTAKDLVVFDRAQPFKDLGRASHGDAESAFRTMMGEDLFDAYARDLDALARQDWAGAKLPSPEACEKAGLSPHRALDHMIWNLMSGIPNPTRTECEK